MLFFNPFRTRELPAATKTQISEQVKIYKAAVQAEADDVHIPPFMVMYIVDNYRARLEVEAMIKLEEETDAAVKARGCII